MSNEEIHGRGEAWQEGREFNVLRNDANIFRSVFCFEPGVYRDKSCSPCSTLKIIRISSIHKIGKDVWLMF